MSAKINDISQQSASNSLPKSLLFSMAFLFINYKILNWIQYNLITNDTSELSVILIYYVFYNIGHAFFYVVTYSVFYYIQVPTIEKYKIEKNDWPWIENPEKWKTKNVPMYIQGLKKYTIVYTLIFISNFRYMKFDYRRETVPDSLTFWLQVVASFFLADFFYYWGHRCFHIPYFYNLFHREHHQATSVVVYDSFVASITEGVLLGFGPLVFSQLIFGSSYHMTTIIFIFDLLNLVSLYGHSGYDFELDPLKVFVFSLDARFHQHHHDKINGNFGIFSSFWDTVLLTRIYNQNRQSVQKNNKINRN